MVKYYTPDFKLETVKRVQRTGEPVSKIAEELGFNPNTLHGWIKRVCEHI
jgi:transposase